MSPDTRLSPECDAELPPGDDVKVKIPTLFGTYLRYGAKVMGHPAIDREFGTIDFLTILDVGAMDPATFQRFAGP